MSSSILREIQAYGLDVRSLVKGDLPQVLELERLGYSHPWTEAVFLDCFKDTYRLWALVQEGDLRGYAVVSYMVDEAHLLNICIHPRVRGQGAGRQLLRHVLAASLKDGMGQMILEVRQSNVAAAMLYRSEGFEEIGRRPGYYPDAAGREDALVLAYRFT
ncbi:MAG: ribosomal-protein-alanine acetyltransferase [Marinobacter excellens HL-55]|uniref:[Ribosomal protein bS18]-alanine N-acetyltransferase n=1 Tax=Marinobacter excellens HL-55 TaxID=1305731 RepID=A0A0P8CVI7_9GAMM|nr:MAG: ribosomal-protein-alanine acetyltransferase [Marinobacter excellens HL-55]